MSKKLISIRIDEKILLKLDTYCNKKNNENVYDYWSQRIYLNDGYISRGKIIEKALELYFENLEQKSNTNK